uniref:Crustin n=1 Tax=Macrobrachium rosenbergii TaxID=79674 RepID=A0A173G7V9_MACRS|nr:crustin [Macrobrachium rosenbergii]
MAIVTILPLVLAVSSAFLANGVSATGLDIDPWVSVINCFVPPCPPCIPRDHEEIPGCRNFCDKPGQPGEYFCCDEDQGPGSRRGTCPKTNFLEDEINVLCSKPERILCKSDRNCGHGQKCCYTADTQHRICRKVAYGAN